MKKSLATISFPLITLIFLGIFVEIIQPRLGTLMINCAIGIALIVFSWKLNLKTSWLARIILVLGILWLGYLCLYYVTGLNNPQF